MESIIILNTTRTHYCKEEAADSSMTVKELVEILEDFDEEDSSVIFSNDNGYTYGKIQSYNITEAEYKTDYEEEEENNEE